MPDILVIDIPERFASETLPLGRYYPIVNENDLELAEIEASSPKSALPQSCRICWRAVRQHFAAPG